MWSLDYVQVPIAEKQNVAKSVVVEEEDKELKGGADVDENVRENESDNDKRRKRMKNLVEQMSVSAEQTTTTEEGGGRLVKSGSESSLSEDDKINTKENAEEEEKERCSGKEDEDDNYNDNDNDKNAKLACDLEFRKRLSIDNKSKSEEIRTTASDDSSCNKWRRSSCKDEVVSSDVENDFKSGE